MTRHGAANGLVDAAEATRNPRALSYALFAYGFAHRDTDPVRALDALRRGLAIAQDSGNRFNESALAALWAASRPSTATRSLRSITSRLAIRNYHDSGNSTTILSALAILAVFFDRLGRYESAATIAGFAFSPLTAAWSPRSPLRSPTCARSSATRPTNRWPTRARR